MALESITKEATPRVKAIAIVAAVAIVVVLAIVLKPEGGYYGTFWSLVPPLVAIILALVTKEVYSSLFIGILLGALLWGDFNFEQVMIHLIDHGFVGSVADAWDAGILFFLVVLGVIGVLVFRSGGTEAFGRWAMKHVKSRRGAQLATWFLGVLIFVDDYFNCLTVGSVMRPLTDKFNISRAKLAYLIDSTAAPICIIAPVSSWAAAVASSLDGTLLPAGANAMDIFIECIGYNLYAILTIIMVICIAVFELDFGPMKVHEDNAKNGDLYTTEGRPYAGVTDGKSNENGHVLDLIIPIFIFLIPACIIALVYTGGLFDGTGVSFRDAFANCDAARGLAMGSLVGLVLTIIYYIVRRSAAFPTLMDSLPQGFRNMVPAILILIFAWTLCTMTKAGLGSADYVTSTLANAESLSHFLPAIFMLIACFIAFSTGTSWGTMGILLPIVVPVFFGDYQLMLVGIAASMAGAVFGDHCSPISDTTIMSSAGAQCDHVNHVATQTPYALVVAGVCFVFYLILGFWQSYIVTAIAAVVMVALLFGLKTFLAKKQGAAPAAE